MKRLFLIICLLNIFKLSSSPLNCITNSKPSFNSSTTITVDALYWQMMQNPMWCYTMTGYEGTSQNPQIENFKTLSYDFKPGIRANIIHDLMPNCFDLRASYTWYYTKTSDDASGSWVTPVYLPPRVLIKHDFYEYAHIDWSANFNIIDLDIGKSFIHSPLLTIRPYLGLKGGWIYQKINGLWQNPIVNQQRTTYQDKERFLNNFAGLGPKLGVSNDWALYKTCNCQFSLLGEFETAFLFGHWNLYDNIITNEPGVIGAYTHAGNRHFGTVVFRGLLSINMQSYITDGKYRLNIALGYEAQNWLNQYQLLDDLMGSNNISLTLQGLTMKVGIDF
jgi:hypothetical protein